MLIYMDDHGMMIVNTMCTIYISSTNLSDVRGGEYLEFKTCLSSAEFILYARVASDFLKHFTNPDLSIYLHRYV